VISSPAAIIVACARPATGTGELCSSVVPSPSWPCSLSPQATASPDWRRATKLNSPPATSAIPDNPGTTPGVARSETNGLVGPMPSIVNALLPQVMTVPSFSTAALAEYVAPSDRTPARPTTGTGTRRSMRVPSPSCPESFLPHARTVPSASSANECLPCPTTAETTFVSPWTCTGTSRSVAVPSPVYSPHAQSVPSPRNAITP
jgi:hypothetical protein